MVRGGIVFLSFSLLLFFFCKTLEKPRKTSFVSPCEDVTLDGLSAGAGLPSVRLGTTRKKVSAKGGMGLWE